MECSGTGSGTARTYGNTTYIETDTNLRCKEKENSHAKLGAGINKLMTYYRCNFDAIVASDGTIKKVKTDLHNCRVSKDRVQDFIAPTNIAPTQGQ